MIGRPFTPTHVTQFKQFFNLATRWRISWALQKFADLLSES